MNKYHVSMSTIVMQIAFCYQETYNKLTKEYLIKGGKKTSVKPKEMWEGLTTQEKTIYFTNIVYLYFAKKTANYVSKERDIEIKQILNKYLTQTKEDYYDYNRFIRNQTRMMRNKKNRKYMKGLIEQYGKND